MEYIGLRVPDPCIILIRDIDTVGVYGRGLKGNQTSNQIISAIDGIDREDGSAVIFIGTSTKPSKIDDSLLATRRFDREILFSLPNKKQRIKFIKDNLEKSTSNSDSVNVEWWAEKTKGFPVADIESLIISAIHGKYMCMYIVYQYHLHNQK